MSMSTGTVYVLHPGDVAVGTAGDRLETLLGSCVAVVLTDSRRTVGAMCHIVHASASPRGAEGDTAYAAQAIDRMHALLMAHGLPVRGCDGFVYGGGNMFPHLFGSAAPHVGTRNVDAVLMRLRDDGVRIVHQDVGGNAYRRLAWTVGVGVAEVAAVEV